MAYRSERVAQEARRDATHARPRDRTRSGGLRLPSALAAIGITALGLGALGLGAVGGTGPGHPEPVIAVAPVEAPPPAPPELPPATGAAAAVSAALTEHQLGGFAPLRVPLTIRTAHVSADSLFGLAPDASCTVRFGADPSGCTAAITCDGRTLYASGAHDLACVRSLGSETAAWDPAAGYTFSFTRDRVRVLETGHEDGRELTLDYDPIAPPSRPLA